MNLSLQLTQKIVALLFLLLIKNAIIAQDYTQTIRGTVLDKQSQITLPGASLQLLNVTPLLATSTDVQGKFRFEKIAVGRHQLKISFLGYKEIVMPVLLNSGKELVLTVELEENAIEIKEVVISASGDKSKANNEMSVISSRVLSMEESNRYAGTRNDPARMAGNLAGVAGGSDQRNDIVIRGNSPTGLLWRLEGVDIPNPNHFAVNGSTSGPISILNNNTLANSDFMTSAFPAEYINALSGTFDLKMRNGNNEKYEYVGQFGVNGFELGAEGPFSKKKDASFMANYRYSNLTLMQKLGINFGSGSTPFYHDGSFKVNFPVKRGVISAFGLGGKSDISLLARNQKADDVYRVNNYDFIYAGHMLASGVNYTQFVGTNAYIKFALSYGNDGYANVIDSNDTGLKNQYRFRKESLYKGRTSLTTTFNKKFNSQITLRTGTILDRMDYNFKNTRYYGGDENKSVNLLNNSGSTFLNRTYIEGILKPNDKIAIYPGVSFMHLFLNNSSAIEPRLAMQYTIDARRKFNLGYGLHSKTQDLTLYLVESKLADGNYVKTNRDLGFTRAHHFVTGYDFSITEHLRLKTEVYYQLLYNVPVETHVSSFSYLNSGSDFGIFLPDSLANNGTGYNYGAEFTLERFFNKGWYFLTTTSIYQSRSKGSDGIERNTAFNGNYVLNGLAGKEFKIKERHFLTVDYKLTTAGGKRVTPINIAASTALHRTIYDYKNAYSNQLDAYFRMDLKIAYRLNSKKTTQEWAVSIENLTNRNNIFTQEFDPINNKVVNVSQLKLFIVGFYRINF